MPAMMETEPAAAAPAPEPDSFQLRTKNAIGGHYQSCMRRSLQSIVLYEADRCLGHRYSQLRPFQRKYALYSTAVDLLNSLEFLTDYHRHEIMFRTNASKEPLAPDLAWRRMKLITREINQTFVPKAKKFMDDEANKDKSHDEICSMILQAMYEENTENSDKPYPPTWEFNHNNAFSVYRIYYRGAELDKNLFAPLPPRVVEVPVKKPSGKGGLGPNDDVTLIPLFGSLGARGRLGGGAVLNDEERRAMLREVKEHTELLKEFEGVIPEEELAKRKRALYASMPPVPPSIAVAAMAKAKMVNSVTAALQKKKKAKVEEVAAPLPQAPAAMPQAADPEPAAAPKSTAAEPASEPAAMEEDWQNVKAEESGATMASV